MPRRVRLTAAERRRAILDAALQTLGDRGYHGTSLDEIAKAAGVSKALIYEHFDSKRALHDALMQEHLSDLYERLAENTKRGGTGAERLRGGIDLFLQWVEERREAFRVLFRDVADPELAEALDDVNQQAIGVIAALMTAEGRGAAVDPRAIELFAVQFSGAMQFLAFWWVDHPEVPREEVVDRAMDFSWTGIERTRRGEGRL